MLARLARYVLVAAAVCGNTQANAAPTIYGTYYDDSVTQECPSDVGTCRVDFSQIPSDKLLMVNRVTCFTATVRPIVSMFLKISTTLGGTALARFHTIAVAPPQFLNATYWMSTNQDMHWLIGQGRFPFVTAGVSTTTSFYMQCSLTGDLVTPIQ